MLASDETFSPGDMATVSNLSMPGATYFLREKIPDGTPIATVFHGDHIIVISSFQQSKRTFKNIFSVTKQSYYNEEHWLYVFSSRAMKCGYIYKTWIMKVDT